MTAMRLPDGKWDNFTTLADGDTALSFGILKSANVPPYSIDDPNDPTGTKTITITNGKRYYSDVAYAIDVTPTTGAGSTDITISYAEGSNPNDNGGSGHGLGYKTVVTLHKVEGIAESPLSYGLNGMLMARMFTGGMSISPSALGSGYFRMYVGVANGGAGSTEPTETEVFSPGDKAGPYTGSLTITATAV
jgi:hypothetical protein